MGSHNFTNVAALVQVMYLRCIQSYSVEGDHVLLTFDGREVWSSGHLKMHPRPSSVRQVTEFGVLVAQPAHVSDSASSLAEIMLPDESYASSRFELWKRGALGKKACLGAVCVCREDAQRGAVQKLFIFGAARYALSFRVLHRYSGPGAGNRFQA